VFGRVELGRKCVILCYERDGPPSIKESQYLVRVAELMNLKCITCIRGRHLVIAMTGGIAYTCCIRTAAQGSTGGESSAYELRQTDLGSHMY